jgi:thioredoxin-related protein
MMIRLSIAVLAAAAMVACSSDQESATQPLPKVEAGASLDPAKGINWFDGSVEDGFAAAKESGKPIFLYWGAVWCPPCHAVSATIFKSPEFLERAKLFVPVYLDGDTKNAQAYGEKFGVKGYPTMIVFDSEGIELTRIPGGIDLQAYANVLDLTLNHASSASELVASIAAGSESLAAADCTLLAYYSWGQDTTILDDADVGATFRGLYEACPADLAAERSILYLGWLDEVIAAANAEEDAVPLSDKQQAEALLHFAALLADDDLIKANIFTVLFSGADYVKALTAADSDERNALLLSYGKALDRIAADESVYKRERIYTLIGKIGSERIDDEEAELSSELQGEIMDIVRWADETTPSAYERQPIINALGGVLEDAGMDDAAMTLLLAELEVAKTPYYYMVSIADIEQRAGNIDVAVDWLRKAYQATTGSATRFQWGYYYINGLLEMTPEDTQLIHDTTVGLVDELQNSGGLYQRPKAQLRRLEGHLVKWSEENDRATELADIRNSVMAVCASASHQDESRTTCDAFLQPPAG